MQGSSTWCNLPIFYYQETTTNPWATFLHSYILSDDLSFLPLAGRNLTEPWIALHNRIMPVTKKIKSKVPAAVNKLIVGNENSETAAIPLSPPPAESVPLKRQPRASSGINKNAILAEYQNFCCTKGITDQASTTVRGKILPTDQYPSHHRLIADCKMKPSARLYYQAKHLHFDNVVIFIGRWPGRLFLTDDDLSNLKKVSKIYKEMIDDV